MAVKDYEPFVRGLGSQNNKEKEVISWGGWDWMPGRMTPFFLSGHFLILYKCINN